jgi:hypothetical protein
VNSCVLCERSGHVFDPSLLSFLQRFQKEKICQQKNVLCIGVEDD